MHMLKMLVGSALIAATAACNPTINTEIKEQANKAPDLGTLYQNIGDDYVRHNPNFATLLALSPEQAKYDFASQLPDYSPAGTAKLRKTMAQHLVTLKAIPADADPDNTAIISSITAYYAGSNSHPQGFIDSWGGHLPYVVNQINGPLIDIPQGMQDQFLVKNRQDADNYIARLSKLANMVDGVVAQQQADAKSGWVPPKALLNGAVAANEQFSKNAAANHPLVTSFATKLAEISSISGADQNALLQTATTLLNEEIYPAYRRAANASRSLLSNAANGDGIWAQPGGSEYYEYMIKAQGDSDLSANAIHELGLSEVKRIDKEMDALLRSVGLTEGSVGQRTTSLLDQDQFIYEDSDKGRQQLLDSLNEQIATIAKRLPEQFKSIPTQKVVVRRIPKAIEAGAPGGQYQSPSLDGSQPGIYWINLRNMHGAASFTLKTLTYHEAIPGHHFQTSLNIAQTDLPFLRRVASFNAYSEGWALYSELLASEMGMYVDDPYGDIGRLQDEMFRAVRLVVDTGLHHHKWSREKAIEYMASVTGKDQSEVVPEIERYMAWPGQALGYKMGMLKLLSLRESAKSKLGERFDIREFHDQILLAGGMPMAQLEKRLNAWAASL